MTEHFIAPPWDLKQQWREQAPRYRDGGIGRELWLMDRAAQWGYEQVNEAKLQQARDEELEACCEWLADETPTNYINALRAARRPKPPSLKEQALEEVDAFEGMGTCNIDIIRRALEALPDD
jgi:hypothetical protein